MSAKTDTPFEQRVHPRLKAWADALLAESPSAKPFVILDRDGVINEQLSYYIKGPEDVQPVPGSLQTIDQLNQRGLRVAVATNQSGIAKGVFSRSDVDAIHRKICDQLAPSGPKDVIQHFAICPHQEGDDCPCRKPRTGLLQEISNRFAADITGSPFVGDSYRDLLAALRYDLVPVLVASGNGLATMTELAQNKSAENDRLKETLSCFASLKRFYQALFA